MDLSKLGGGIKSIQSGTTSVNASSTLNVTVSAVSIEKSMLLIDKHQVIGGPSGPYNGGVLATLTSSTNIQMVSSGLSGSLQVAWQLVEFN